MPGRLRPRSGMSGDKETKDGKTTEGDKQLMKRLSAIMVSLAATALASRDPATCPHTSCSWKMPTNGSTCTQWYVCNDCGKALYYRNVTPAHTYHGQPVKNGHDNCGHNHP